MIGVPLSSAPLTAAAIAPSSATGIGRRRCAGSERLLQLGDPAVAVEVEREGGGAEHRPGGSVPETLTASPSTTGSAHVAAASIG